MNERITTVRTHLQGGGNVCPYSSRAKLHYVTDTADYRPALYAMRPREGVIIVAGSIYDRLFASRGARADLDVLQLWSWLCFLKATVATAPPMSFEMVMRSLKENTLPYMPFANPQLLVRDRPTIASCLGPLYDPGHPRFSPVPIVLFTWASDNVPGIGRLPAVREAMVRAHGFGYDGMRLVIPPPGRDRDPRYLRYWHIRDLELTSQQRAVVLGQQR